MFRGKIVGWDQVLDALRASFNMRPSCRWKILTLNWCPSQWKLDFPTTKIWLFESELLSYGWKYHPQILFISHGDEFSYEMNSLTPKGVAEWKDAALVWDLFLPMEIQDALSVSLIRGHLNLPCFRKWAMLSCIQKYMRRFKHSCFSFLISPLLLWSLILLVVNIHIITTDRSKISG